jgi:hypothetical protein
MGMEWHNRATMGPAALKPGRAAFTLRPSVEAELVSDIEPAPLASHQPGLARPRLLAWLGEGVREVSWVLSWLPRARWAVPPPSPSDLGTWPALRHVRHLALHETRLCMPAVRRLAGAAAATDVPGQPTDEPSAMLADVEREDAAWDAEAAAAAAEAIVAELAAARFELLQQAEMAPDAAWPQIEALLLRARQHELEHLAALWRLALYWEAPSTSPHASPTSSPASQGGNPPTSSPAGQGGVPLHPADRFSQGVTLR